MKKFMAMPLQQMFDTITAKKEILLLEKLRLERMESYYKIALELKNTQDDLDIARMNLLCIDYKTD